MEAQKYDKDKPRHDLFPDVALDEIAHVLTYGAKKYGDHNWRQGNGLQYSRLIAAARRHISAFMQGQETDEETELHHLAHACCCLMFLLEYESQVEKNDDRYCKMPEAV